MFRRLTLAWRRAARRDAIAGCLRGLGRLGTVSDEMPGTPFSATWRRRKLRSVAAGTACDLHCSSIRAASDRGAGIEDVAQRPAKYHLIEFRTRETLKGRMRESARGNVGRWRGRVYGNHELLREASAAGLVPLRIQFEGEFSDRAWLLAESRAKDGAPSAEAQQTTIEDVEIRAPQSLPAAAVLFLVIFLMYCINLLGRSFWGENEAYYALGARSVLEGSLLLPQVYEGVYVDKPPLVFWWVALVSAFFGGVTEWTARLANVISSMMVLLAMHQFSARRLGRWVGLLAVLMLATSWEYWENSTEVNTDVTLCALLAWAWGLLYTMLERRRFSRWRWATAWGLLGLAMLAKGPVAIVLSGMVALVYALGRFGWREGWRRLWNLAPVTGLLLAIVPFATWMGLVYGFHGAEPVETVLIKHNFQRFTNAFDHVRPWHFYLGELPVNLLPWSPLLVVAGILVVHRRRSGISLPRPVLFSLVAMLVVFVFFSLSSSKRDYYLLPLMPWAAIVMAEALACVVLGPVGARSGLGGRAFAGRLLSSTGGRSFAAASALVFAGFIGYAVMAISILDRGKSAVPLALAIDRLVRDEESLVLLDEEDPRLLYYLREKFIHFSDGKADMARLSALLQTDFHADILVSEDDLKDLGSLEGVTLYLEERITNRGKDYYLLTNKAESGQSEFDVERARERKKRGRGDADSD